jgi:hypothetical protein
MLVYFYDLIYYDNLKDVIPPFRLAKNTQFLTIYQEGIV